MQTINNCSERGFDVGNLKVGDSLKPDSAYCNAAFETALVFGCMIFSSLWLKLCKKCDKDWEKLIEVLIDQIYDLLLDDKWNSAKVMIEFVFDDLKIELPDIYRRMLKINYALCYKELGNKIKAREILETEDWRGSDHSFQAAASAVLGETDKAIGFIKTGYAAEQLDKQALSEWPVFNHIRSTKKFKKMYAELLGEDEAARAATDPSEKHHAGPAMKKLVTEAWKQIDRWVNKENPNAVGESAGTTANPEKG